MIRLCLKFVRLILESFSLVILILLRRTSWSCESLTYGDCLLRLSRILVLRWKRLRGESRKYVRQSFSLTTYRRYLGLKGTHMKWARLLGRLKKFLVSRTFLSFFALNLIVQ